LYHWTSGKEVEIDAEFPSAKFHSPETAITTPAVNPCPDVQGAADPLSVINGEAAPTQTVSPSAAVLLEFPGEMEPGKCTSTIAPEW
jgi:hypothetical protein